MRIDKYLQVSRIIKRRSIAKEIIEKKRIYINGNVAKPSSNVKIDDLILIKFNDFDLEVRVLIIDDKVSKSEAINMYEITKDRGV